MLKCHYSSSKVLFPAESFMRKGDGQTHHILLIKRCTKEIFSFFSKIGWTLEEKCNDWLWRKSALKRGGGIFFSCATTKAGENTPHRVSAESENLGTRL